MSYGVTDRIRFTIIKVNSNEIVARDLVTVQPTVTVNLSGPSRCSFKIPASEQSQSSYGIDWKSWKYWIVPEIEIAGVRKCLGAQLVNRVSVDPQDGSLSVEGLGFMGYPKGIPWLDDYNPVTIDVAAVVQRVWASIQNYTNANLGVQVLPASLGLEMTPGYSFDGGTLNFAFTAIFIRAVDFIDSGDFIGALSRDIPFDMVEEVTWNTSRTAITKVIRLGYKYIGYEQPSLAFVHGENVISAELREEAEIEPVTDVIIRGWRPGKVFSTQLNIETMNEQLVAEGKEYQIYADPMERVRRVIMEEDANIDSTERAKAWARRRLTRRNIPKSFTKITIDPSHPNAPIGSFWLGDTVTVKARNYPWVGNISEKHRITSITFKDNEPAIELGLIVDGAFNFDPVIYSPYSPTNPTVDKNLLSNGGFGINTAGWRIISGEWIRFTTEGYTSSGCMRVETNDAAGEFYESHRIPVNPGGSYKLSAWVRRENVVKRSDFNATVDGIYIGMKHYKDGGVVGNTIYKLNSITNPEGTGPWTKLESTITVPSGTTVNEISILLCAKGFTSGSTWWDDVKVLAQ